MQRRARNVCRSRGIQFCSLLLVLLIFPARQVAAASQERTEDKSWSLLGGYGYSQPGWGLTTVRVETLDLVPRYDLKLTGTLGSSWYQGFHSLLLEAPLHLVVSPDVAPMFGLNFLASYCFTASERHRPYILAGGGPVYSTADIEGMGAELNGNYQFGLGWKYRRDNGQDLLFEYRFHHISNAGTEDPNEPLNSNKFLIGTTF